ncbi:MAG TPA: hypothetical protein VGF17_16260 [Phytomonospora sp.]
MTTLIDFAGVHFNTGAPDADDCVWNMRIPKGWAAPVQQVDVVEPTTAPGGDQAVNRAKPRPLVARWIVRAPSDAAAWAAYERCQAMPGFGLNKAAILVVHEPVAKWLQVIQTGIDVDEPRGNRLVFAEVDLSALYPYRRGVEERTETLAPGQTKTLQNAGREAAPLKVTTTGAGVVKLRQTASGQLMQTRVSVASGTVLDSRTSSAVTAGGVEFFPMGSPSEWLSLPAGDIDGPSSTNVTNQGGAPVLLSWYDTY